MALNEQHQRAHRLVLENPISDLDSEMTTTHVYPGFMSGQSTLR